MKKTNEYYKSILEDLGLVVDTDDVVKMEIGDDLIPVKAKDDRVLVLPTREQLKMGNDWTGRLAFHPLSESVTRSESTVFNILKQYVVFSITSHMAAVIQALMEVVTDKEVMGSLKPSQAKMLSKVTKYRKSTSTVINKLLKKANPNDVDHRIINLYVKRGGKVGNETYSRACIVTSPLLEKFKDDELGIKFQNSTDKQQALNLIEAVFDGWDTDYFNNGTNNTCAPSFTALMTSFEAVASRINHVIDTFSDIKPELADITFKLDWTDLSNKNLTKLSQAIPALDGNTGAVPGSAEDKPTHVPKSTKSHEVPKSTSGWGDMLSNPNSEQQSQSSSWSDMLAPPAQQVNSNMSWDEMLAPKNTFGNFHNMGQNVTSARPMSRFEMSKQRVRQQSQGFVQQEDILPWCDPNEFSTSPTRYSTW